MPLLYASIRQFISQPARRDAMKKVVTYLWPRQHIAHKGNVAAMPIPWSLQLDTATTSKALRVGAVSAVLMR